MEHQPGTAVQPGEDRLEFVVRRVDREDHSVVIEAEWSAGGEVAVFTGIRLPLPALGALAGVRVGDRLELRVLPRPAGA